MGEPRDVTDREREYEAVAGGQRLPYAVILVAALFLVSGWGGAERMARSLVDGGLFLDGNVIGLVVGIGLLRLNGLARQAALVLLLLGVAVAGWTVVQMLAGGDPRSWGVTWTTPWGDFPGDMGRDGLMWILTVASAVFGLAIWALTRPPIRGLFRRR
jgi:hypothetical protein